MINITLPASQLNKLKSATKNITDAVLRLPSNVIRIGEIRFSCDCWLIDKSQIHVSHQATNSKKQSYSKHYNPEHSW